jgi:hypothetical protein
MTLPNDFNPLDDKYRYCVYCFADCWPEPENQRHGPNCPVVTGLFPVMEMERLPDGTFGGCSYCAVPLKLGDVYVLVNDDTGTVTKGRPTTGWVVCLGCAAVGADPRVEGNQP